MHFLNDGTLVAEVNVQFVSNQPDRKHWRCGIRKHMPVDFQSTDKGFLSTYFG
jgi:hypothetical protein